VRRDAHLSVLELSIVGALALAGCRQEGDLPPAKRGGVVVMDTKKGALDDAERSEIEAAIAVYLGAGKQWRPEDYRIEHRGARDDDRVWVVWAVHADDEKGLAPGGGKSLELWVDRKSKRITKELGFQ
jgi:hypothetical protein